jgi:small subunit ribosomal protein S20
VDLDDVVPDRLDVRVCTLKGSDLSRRRHPEVPRTVANIKSQIKRNRQNEKRRLRNKAVRSEIRTRTKAAVNAASYATEDRAELLRLAVKRIDKAAAKGVIHKNQAANRKSRLARRIAALSAEAS